MKPMPLRLFFFLLILLGSVAGGAGVRAQETTAETNAETTVAATVNDSAITNVDVADRAALLFLSSGLPRTPQNITRVKERALRTLIDEKLEVQEAQHDELDVEKADVDRALAMVAKQNNLAPEQLDGFFSAKGVPKQTLIDQIKAALLWSKVIQRVLRPQVAVGDDEVAAALERIKANEGKTEYLLSEIYLSLDNPADEDKIRQLAEDIVKRLGEGASFTALAQQFSQGSTAVQGGDLGWIQPGQLQGELDRAARDLKPNQISLPIRMADGFHIIGKREERVITAQDESHAEFFMKQAALPLHGRSLEQARDEVEAFKKTINSCTALATHADEFPSWKVSNLGSKHLAELPPWLATLAKTQPLGKPGAAMQQKDYALLLYVCERNDSNSSHDLIQNQIGNEKLDLQARRLLRDLRRAAAIEIK